MSARQNSGLARKTSFETFESRIVFSVDSVPADLILQGDIDPGQAVELTSLDAAHQSSGADYVFNDYGFDGAGQTVAIIDSGIAWDHYALGAGYGADYRVVGGWDFAEGDANPYDDGPAGFHGTHVAGIVGSDDADNLGVASGVDLVGLRVFGDNGEGNLEWVEQVLQWVHDHKDDFANPITTVNLSLGVDWNANYLPDWASLEDEFAQLEADNIFISVAAGNAFQNYNSAGLAYPAVSDHVVPVASHGANGSLSDFSQRNDRVIVAPGESIRSTVPDHLLGSSQHNSFLGASGTSMAAPYTAGASAVLREAMEFMGYSNVNQDMLYEHFRNTADQIYDSVTSGVYHRLNLARAVDAVVTDLHGSAAADATDIGSLVGGESLHGTIGKLTDVDAFSFTASTTGQLTLTLQQTHELNAVIKLNDQLVSLIENTVTMDVVAGEHYTISLSTNNGLGHYEISLDLQQSMAAYDFGIISHASLDNQSVNGESWYSVTAVRSGILSGTVSDAGLQLEIYDSSMNLLSTGVTQNEFTRADATVNAGSRYLVKVTGQQSGFDLRLLNQVALDNGVLQINGNEGNDAISVNHRPSEGRVYVSVAEMQYWFSSDQINHINIEGSQGSDQLAVELGGHADQVFLSADRVFVTGESFSLASGSFDAIHAHGDSSDKLTYLDSIGNDIFRVDGAASSMMGSGFYNSASGFTNVTAVSRAGVDTAEFSGSTVADHIYVDSQHAQLNNELGHTVAIGFAGFQADGQGGSDSLVIGGGAGADQFELQGQSAFATLDGSQVSGTGFESIIVVSGGGDDSAVLTGTAGDDRFYASSTMANLSGANYKNTVLNVRNVVADVTTDAGHDTAFMVDSVDNDTFIGNQFSIQISGGNYSNVASGFQVATVVADHGGFDQATFVGSQGTDTMYAEGNSAFVWGTSYLAGMVGFENIAIDGGGGNDSMLLRGTGLNTSFYYAGSTVSMSETNLSVTASRFERIKLDGGGGQNLVSLDGFADGDQLTAEGSGLLAYLNDVNVRAENFVWLEAMTEDDSVADAEIGAVDFWYSLHGDWD